MRWHEILEYKTKAGDDIAIEYHEDIEGDENRGWQVDKLDAYVNGEYAGYIKVGYIPSKRFKEHYPTLLNYMDKMGGNIILPRDKRSADYRKLSDEDLRYIIKNLAYQTKYHEIWNSSGKVGMPETRKELIAIIQDIIKNSRKGKEQREKFKEFKDRYVDKPYVDFIRVFHAGEDRYDSSTDDKEIGQSSRDFQRQRIGTALYLEAAKWLAKKGFKLYASTGQSKSAQAAWKNLEKLGHVAYDGDRRYVKL